MSVTSTHRSHPNTSCSSCAGSWYTSELVTAGLCCCTNDAQSCAHCPLKQGTAKSMIQLSPKSVPNLFIKPVATDEMANGSWNAGTPVSLLGVGNPSGVFERYGHSEG